MREDGVLSLGLEGFWGLGMDCKEIDMARGGLFSLVNLMISCFGFVKLIRLISLSAGQSSVSLGYSLLELLRLFIQLRIRNQYELEIEFRLLVIADDGI